MQDQLNMKEKQRGQLFEILQQTHKAQDVCDRAGARLHSEDNRSELDVLKRTAIKSLKAGQ